MKDKATIKIRRRDASTGESKLEEFTVPYQEGMRVVDGLIYIFEEKDHSLAHRYSCKIGNCKVCLMKANGKTIYSCQERLVDGMVLEPMHEYAEIRDLVVDLHQRIKKS